MHSVARIQEPEGHRDQHDNKGKQEEQCSVDIEKRAIENEQDSKKACQRNADHDGCRVCLMRDSSRALAKRSHGWRVGGAPRVPVLRGSRGHSIYQHARLRAPGGWLRIYSLGMLCMRA